MGLKIRYMISLFFVCTLTLAGCVGAQFSTHSITGSSSPHHIALLVPLTGPLAHQGKVVRDGFFAAYYQNPQHTTKITIMDTNRNNIVALYQQAAQQGADFIVGPLIKNDLQQLVKAKAISLPTLALNALDDNPSRINQLFQFGLSPIDESIQAASKAWDDQQKRIIIISPSGSWEEKIVSAFMNQWKYLGGQVTTHLLYNNHTDLNAAVATLLNIDKAEGRHQELSSLLNKKIRFIPYRRQDFDAVFLVAKPTVARQIIPLLKFYYAGDIPVYSLSMTYPGTIQSSGDPDLNGLIFNDMPWILQKEDIQSSFNGAIRQQIRSLWPTEYHHYSRLFALGVDAYNLISELPQLSRSHESGMNGATGTLYVLPNQRIYRKLLWAKMIKGQPQLTSPM